MKTNEIKHLLMLVTFVRVTLFTACSEDDPAIDTPSTQNICPKCPEPLKWMLLMCLWVI